MISIEPRPSVLALWRQARADLEAVGAQVVDVDLPVVSRYEGDRPDAPTIRTRGLVTARFLDSEILDLAAWAWDDFLRANGDPALPSLDRVDGERIFPAPEGALPDRYDGFDDRIADYPAHVRAHPGRALTDVPFLEEGLRGLEETRRVDLEDWMDQLGLDALVLPAAADVGRADMEVDPVSADAGWRNGVWVSTGNLVWRHLGVPTVTVPMGLLADIGMPVGLTVAGRAYDDSALLRIAAAYERLVPRRVPPPRTAGPLP